MSGMHIRQLGFTYSVCKPSTKKQKENTKIQRNRIFKIKACFQHDMAYGDFKNFTRRTTSDKTFHDKSFNIAKNPKYVGYQRGLASTCLNLQINLLSVVDLKIKIFRTENKLKNF